MLEDSRDLDLPRDLANRNELLIDYSKARVKFDKVNLEVLQNPSDTTDYQAQFSQYTAEIDALIEKISSKK